MILIDVALLWRLLESWIDDLVCLERGDHDVEYPEADEERGGDGLDALGPAQLAAADLASDQKSHDGDAGLDTEHRHGEAQAGMRR